MNLNKYDPCNLMALLKAANDKLKNPNTIDKERYQKIAIKLQARIDYLLDEIDKPKQSKAVLSEQDKEVFINMFNKITDSKIRTIPEKARKQIINILGYGHTIYHIGMAIENAKANMTNLQYLTPEFITRDVEFHKYMSMKRKATTTNYVAPAN